MESSVVLRTNASRALTASLAWKHSGHTIAANAEKALVCASTSPAAASCSMKEEVGAGNLGTKYWDECVRHFFLTGLAIWSNLSGPGATSQNGHWKLSYSRTNH